MAPRKTTLSVVYSQANPSIHQLQKSKPSRPRRVRPSKIPLPLLALRDAMHTRYRPDEPLDKDFDLERGLRAIALLLDSLSENGNKSVDGTVVLGLTETLNLFADRIGWRAGRNALGEI